MQWGRTRSSPEVQKERAEPTGGVKTCGCVPSLEGLSVQKDGLCSSWNAAMPSALGTTGSCVVLHKVIRRARHTVSRLWVLQKWVALPG